MADNVVVSYCVFMKQHKYVSFSFLVSSFRTIVNKDSNHLEISWKNGVSAPQESVGACSIFSRYLHMIISDISEVHVTRDTCME